jgi:hypothetical protein
LRSRLLGSCRSSAAEAEVTAFENAIVAHLNANHPDTPSDRCAYCGRAETRDSILLPIGAGDRHVWLHSGCWTTWRARRRAEAIAMLAKAGITP